ncbi:hypothetical protein AB0392_17265 [Nonomuraea angiospora]|uniref:hypothetical protein n=1 Tax=Nonomuraea angiospora TaxID=46172 RepID=UPI00344D7DE0
MTLVLAEEVLAVVAAEQKDEAVGVCAEVGGLGVVFQEEPLQVGDLLFLGPVVVARGCQPFGQFPVVGGERVELLFERGVLGGESLDCVCREAEELADPLALCVDFGGCLLEGPAQR